MKCGVGTSSTFYLAKSEAPGGALSDVMAGELAQEEKAVEDSDCGFGFGAATGAGSRNEFGGPRDPGLKELGHESPVGLGAGCSEASGLEEQRKHRVSLSGGEDRPSSSNKLYVIGCGLDEGGSECLLQPEPDCHKYVTDEIILAREVVHNDPVTDAEMLGDAAERETSEPVGKRQRERAIEDVLLRVLVTHRLLTVVVTANTLIAVITTNEMRTR